MAEPRKRYFMLKIGAPGTGKSTSIADIVKEAAENVIVFKHTADIDDPAFDFLPVKTVDNWRQGVKPGAFFKCKFSGHSKQQYKDFVSWLKLHFRNGLVVIDDALNFERNQSSDDTIELISLRRKYGIDIIMAYYGVRGLPIDLFQLANYVVFFNTADQFTDKKNRIPKIDELQRAQLMAQHNWNTGLKENNKALQYKPEIVKIYSTQ